MIERFTDVIVARSDEAPRELQKVAGRVLLAEDNRDSRALIDFHLRNMGLTVEHAENGKIAREKANAALANGATYDLILMDMQMPELDGYAATASLRIAGYPGPIIALTSNVMEQDRERCLNVGCDHFLAKPVQLDTFQKTVVFYLRRGRAVRPATPLSPQPEPPPGDPRFASIVGQCLADLRIKVDEVCDAASQGNMARVAWLSHQIEGIAGGVGFPAITAATQTVQESIRGAADGTQVDDAIKRLVDVCHEAINAEQ